MGIRGHSSVVSLEEMIRPSPISSRSTMAGTLTRQQKKNVRLVMFLILLACYHNSIRVRSFLLRAALVPPSLSPWRKLYDEGGLLIVPPRHRVDKRGFRFPCYDRDSAWSQPPPAAKGEALVASAGWDVGAFALLSG